MVFFGTVLEVANRFGVLLALHKNNPCYKLITFFCWLSVVNSASHTGFFYIQNIADFDLSTSVLGAFMNMMMHLVKTHLLMFKSDEFVALYFKLRRLCHDPKRSHYEAARKIEGHIELFARIYLSFIVLVATMITINPLIVQAMEYFQTGEVVQYRWEMPFPYASPFGNIKSSPIYEITFLSWTIGIIPLAMFVISADLLFMACCFHIRGLLVHLKFMMQNYASDPNNKELLRRCVFYQNSIYEVVKDTQYVFGGIFFTQYIGTLVIVCTQAFLATKDLSRMISYVTFSSAALSELLIYTFFGTLVTISHDNLMKALVEVEWYKSPPRNRSLLVMMTRQAQKECSISFHNWIHCSQVTLRLLIVNAFNVFAFLQNMAKK